MKVEISVPEVVEIFNEIQQQPERLFEMIRLNIQRDCGAIPDSTNECGVDPFSW